MNLSLIELPLKDDVDLLELVVGNGRVTSEAITSAELAIILFVTSIVILESTATSPPMANSTKDVQR